MFDIYSRDDERAERTEKWPPERIEAEIREYERAKTTVVPVTDLMDTPAGRDETHDADAYDRCDDCGSVYRTTPGHWHRCQGERRYYEGDR